MFVGLLWRITRHYYLQYPTSFSSLWLQSVSYRAQVSSAEKLSLSALGGNKLLRVRTLVYIQERTNWRNRRLNTKNPYWQPFGWAILAECRLWQYGLWSFQTGGTKLERFLPNPLLISTDFLKYPFWHLFQTGIKFQ